MFTPKVFAPTDVQGDTYWALRRMKRPALWEDLQEQVQSLQLPDDAFTPRELASALTRLVDLEIVYVHVGGMISLYCPRHCWHDEQEEEYCCNCGDARLRKGPPPTKHGPYYRIS